MKKKYENKHSPPLLAAPSPASLPSLPQPTVPKKYYPNSETSKDKILEENKNKSGIYMLRAARASSLALRRRWKNLQNGKRYVGSALDFSNRLLFYYSPSKINSALQQGKSYICSAIIKYGLNNFSLEILEYCEPDKLLIREKYYIDLGTEYNIIKDPTIPPMSGREHTNESKKKISDHQKKIDHPGRFNKGDNNIMYGKPKSLGAGMPSQSIEVFDLQEKITTSYVSISTAARALGISSSVINMYFFNNQKKPYKGRYTFKKI